MENGGGGFSVWFMGIVSAVVTAILAIVQHIATREKKTNAEQLKEAIELLRTLRELDQEAEKDEK